jgi:pyroglutamyl-peptidase
MQTIFVTGFEPFGGRAENASWEGVRRLPDQIGNCKVVKKRLPTVFGTAADEAMEAAKEVQPSMILCVGEFGTGKRLHLEQIGINLRYATLPDNAGAQPMGEPVRQDGADGYFATIPVQQAVSVLREQGVPIDVSYTAGAYVCNDLLYSTLYEHRGTDVPCGFLHVPTDLEYDTLAGYIQQVLETLVSLCEGN